LDARDRLIFPYWDINQRSILYIQGRSLTQDNKIRWLAQKNSAIATTLFNQPALNDNDHYLLICEGASDTLTLIDLGLSAVGTASLDIDLKKYVEYFRNRDLIFIYDTDKHAVNSHDLPISWSKILPKLKDLVEKGIRCYCYKVRHCKDINEYVLQYGKEKLRRSIVTYKLPLEEFILGSGYKEDFVIETSISIISTSRLFRYRLDKLIRYHYGNLINILLVNTNKMSNRNKE